MTTPAAAAQYLAEHLAQMSNRKVAIYNPHNKPIEELPTIFGFNNGGVFGFLHALLLSEDGVWLGDHDCSSEGYMPHDLGILEGTRPDRHETFRKHYPDGYKMEFVGYDQVRSHEKLMKIITKLTKEESDEAN